MSAAASRVGSSERRRILMSMGGALPAGKVAPPLPGEQIEKAEQGCRKRKPHRPNSAGRRTVQQPTELPSRIGPSQDGGLHLARQSIEGGAATVFLQRCKQ